MRADILFCRVVYVYTRSYYSKYGIEVNHCEQYSLTEIAN